jgi:hypothetical protein
MRSDIPLADSTGSCHVSQRHFVVTVSEIIANAGFCSYILKKKFSTSSEGKTYSLFISTLLNDASYKVFS